MTETKEKYTTTTGTGENASQYLYPPTRAITVSLTEYQERKDNPSVLSWGMEELDTRIVPAIPGDMTSILGRPGHGKSISMLYLATHHARQLTGVTRTDGKTPVIVYATWETLVEEFIGIISAPFSGYTLEDIGRGNVDMRKMKSALVQVVGSNIVVFGRSKANRALATPPTLFDLDNALFLLEDMGFAVVEVHVDYLQRIPTLDYRGKVVYGNKVEAVSENTDMLKNMFIRHACAGVVGIQAGRDVDKVNGVRIPSLSDAQWSSVVEQTSDKVFGLTMPAKYIPLGSRIAVNGWEYLVQEDTFIVRMLKQRFAHSTANDYWVLTMNPVEIQLGIHPVLGQEGMDDDSF